MKVKSVRPSSRAGVFTLAMALTIAVALALLMRSGQAGLAQARHWEGAVAPPAGEVPPAQVDREKRLVLRVAFHDLGERDRLARELGAEEAPTHGGYLTVLGDADTYRQLLDRGLKVEVDRDATALRNEQTPALSAEPGTFYGGYKTVGEIYAFLDEKVAAYPSLAEKVDIGDSWCKTHSGSCRYPQPYSGFDLYALHVSNRSLPGPKPVFWLDAGIHSNEIAGPELAMRFISWLLDNYGSNADARWLVDWHDIWVMPTFNPDGHHIVEAGGSQPYDYRKNGNQTLGACAWSSKGVDDNRNFPFQWNCCGGSSSDPCVWDYHGTAALSEDEPRAVTSIVSALIPDQRGPGINDPAPITTTGIYQSLHSEVPINIFPWGWSSPPNDRTPNDAAMRVIAAHMSAISAGGNGYPYGTIAQRMYLTDGQSLDWAYGELGIPAYTTELSGGTNLPAYSCIDNPGCGSSRGIWPENRGMFIYMAKIARTPYLLAHGPDANIVTTGSMTVTQGLPVQLAATINFSWSGNTYAQNVGAAEYYVDTPPWAGGAPAAMQPVDGQFNSPTEAVQATIDTSTVPAGMHVVFVRGRGQNQYLGYDTWGPTSAAFLTVLPPRGTPTQTATPSPTPCAFSFSDVPIGDPFYDYVRCLACRTVLSGYSDGTFRPNNNITRGQIAKVVSNAAGFADDVTGMQTYTDVPSTYTFWVWIERLAVHQVMGGYPCGAPGEPCDGQNRPYFRPANNATRGQIAKINSKAAGFNEPPVGQFFADVGPGHPFYEWVQRLAYREIMQGYECGGPGEPCDEYRRPYFRAGNNVTKGQASKIVANTFYPDCQTPER